MSRVTLRIIAEETGLSKFAVSRALSGKSGVSSATRARVRETARRLGYQPGRKADSKTIGAIFYNSPTFNSELMMLTQSGVQEEAQKIGFNLRTHWVGELDEMLEFAESCAGLVTVNIPEKPFFAELLKLDRPIVSNGWFEPLIAIDTVGGTDHEAGSAVAQHLMRLGHREVVYVHGNIDLRGRQERFYGLSEAIGERTGVKAYDVVWEESGGFSDRLSALLRSGARPTAFFCAHDDLALTTITDLMGRGWRIPEDASVVGFGDFSAARYIRPPLTTVRINSRDLGAAAVRLLQARLTIADWPATPWGVRVPSTFIERQTTAPAPSEARQAQLFGDA